MTAPRNEIHVGDETTFRAQITDGGVPVDLSSATEPGTKVIEIKRPSGSLITEELSFVPPPDGAGNGSDGLVQYTAKIAPSVDLVEAGDYQVQATFKIPGTFHTNLDEFEVHANLS